MHLADASGLTKKQVQSIFEALTDAVKSQLGKKGPGALVLPGLIKLRLVKKPPTKARERQSPRPARRSSSRQSRLLCRPRLCVMKSLKVLVV